MQIVEPVGGFVQEPNDVGLSELALLLTIGAAAYLIVICSRGYDLPRPLSEGALLLLAGAWAGVLICYRMLDRPAFELPGVDRVGLRYGIFVAVAGAVLIVVGGLRKRREEATSSTPARTRPRTRPDTPARRR